MPLVAYSVSAKAMCQLQFWAGQENYREYQNALWTIGEEIMRDDRLESNVVLVFLDWLASENGLSFFSPQHLPFSLDCQQSFFVYLVERPAEQPQKFREFQSRSAHPETLRGIAAAYGMSSAGEQDFILIQAFLHDAFRFMADRDDETLVIASH